MKHLVLALALLSTPALAEDIEQTMLRHMEWIAAHSSLPVPDTLPTVEYMTSEMMQIRYYGPSEVAQAEYQGYFLPEVVAMYDPETSTMYLPIGYDHEDINDGATLVHELVHHMQNIRGDYAQNDCGAAGEPEAYHLHNLWIDELGSTEPHTDALLLLMIESACSTAGQRW